MEEKDSNHNRLCAKGGLALIMFITQKELQNLLYERRGIKKDPKEKLDPLNPLSHFREASWEEALESFASKLSSIRDAEGEMMHLRILCKRF